MLHTADIIHTLQVVSMQGEVDEKFRRMIRGIRRVRSFARPCQRLNNAPLETTSPDECKTKPRDTEPYPVCMRAMYRECIECGGAPPAERPCSLECGSNTGGRVESCLIRTGSVPDPRIAPHAQVGDGLSAALPSGVGTGGSSRETEELRASIISVTKREKDRVEGLQAQLEMLRQELRECRKQRGMDQSHIAALESQSSQFKAALACAEDDLEALRTTLDKELGRSHVMQGRISQLEGETRGARKSAKEQDKEVQRLRELVAGLTPARQMEASPGRPGPNWGGEARQPAREEEYEASEREVYDAYVEARRGQLANSMGEARDAAGEALHETHTHRIPTGGGDSSANYSSDFSPSGETPSSEPTPARHRVQVRPASAKAAPRHQRASPDVVAAAPAAAPGGRAKRESTSTIEYLASQVASGHITKSTPLQLALEFCGKSSFSLRHNEEKYNELSQQLVTLAYQHLRDRWVTVLKNAEPTDNKGTMKAPRLGSFEVELLWT